MTEDPAGAVIVVDPDVIEPARILEPNDRAVCVGDSIGPVLARRTVAHTDLVEFRPLAIGAPGHQRVIRRMRRAIQGKERVALPFVVAVDEDLLLALLATLAAGDRPLSALAEPAVIEPFAILTRDGGIVLLDSPAHLGEEFSDEVRGRVQMRRRIGVFRLENGPDRLRQARGIAQHLAPVLRPQPGVLVRQLDAVHDLGRRMRLDGRRREMRPRSRLAGRYVRVRKRPCHARKTCWPGLPVDVTFLPPALSVARRHMDIDTRKTNARPAHSLMEGIERLYIHRKTRFCSSWLSSNV